MDVTECAVRVWLAVGLVRDVRVPCCWPEPSLSLEFPLRLFFFPQLCDLWGFLLKFILLSLGSTSLSEGSHRLPRSLTDCRHHRARGSCVLQRLLGTSAVPFGA